MVDQKLPEPLDSKVNPIAKDAATIEETLQILGDLKNHPKRLPRKHYIQRLADALASKYNYSRELVDFFLRLFSPEECFEFIEANERPRPVTIRSNPLRVQSRRELAKRLIARGVDLDPLAEWTPLGLKVNESQVPIGATPEYLGGFYMLQSASSLVPVIELAPREGESVVDMCAAPGGKTTHIASLMRNTGALLANDANRERLRALAANLHRMGVLNCTVTNYDARELGQHFGRFDRVLLDAPCSGLGVISRDESIRTNKTEEDVRRCSHLQKELILEAIDLLHCQDKRRPGVLVYSTCSVAAEENEEVVNYALKKRFVRLAPLAVGFGVSGFQSMRGKHFSPQLKNARRFYPHVHNMDGFFVAKLIKYKEGRRVEKQKLPFTEMEPDKRRKE